MVIPEVGWYRLCVMSSNTSTRWLYQHDCHSIDICHRVMSIPDCSPVLLACMVTLVGCHTFDA